MFVLVHFLFLQETVLINSFLGKLIIISILGISLPSLFGKFFEKKIIESVDIQVRKFVVIGFRFFFGVMPVVMILLVQYRSILV